MIFNVKVVNPPTNPVAVAPVLTTIQSFTYVIQPSGGQPTLDFGFLVSSDSILENISYYAGRSPALILGLSFPSWNPPPVLGAAQGANVVPQASGRFHFVLQPATTSSPSAIAFTAMTNININQARLDVIVSTPDGTNIPSLATGELTFQFRKRY